MSDLQDFEKAKKELNTEETVNEIYSAQKSVMTGVLSVIPALGPFIDKLSDQKFEAYQTRKRKIFVDAVLANIDIITSDKVRNEAFIINTAKTIELVDRCTSDDKVVYFGNLVRNGYFDAKEQISNDDFEEYEAILGDLSDREIKFLVVFAEHAKRNDYALDGRPLQEYYSEMRKMYPRINPEVILNRLKRTGLVNDQAAWADFGDEDEKADINGGNADGTLVLGSGNAFVLDHGYDDFERIVLRAYDTGKRM